MLKGFFVPMAAEATISSQAMEAVISGLKDVASNIGSAIVAIVPIALGVVGAVIAITFGIRFFRKLVK